MADVLIMKQFLWFWDFVNGILCVLDTADIIDNIRLSTTIYVKCHPLDRDYFMRIR